MGSTRRPHSLRVRRGDVVRVITGDDKGKDGRVLRVMEEDGRIVVEGVNIVHRHVRRSQKNPRGGRITREAPIHVSNVMLLDPEQKVPTRVGRRQKDPALGSLGWERIARKSGQAIGADAGRKGRKKEKE